MKIAIISDSHDNIPNIEKFLDWANENKIDTIIHCGDISAPAVITKEFAPKFKGQIHLVHGNVSDRDLLEEVCDNHEKITLHGDKGEIEVDAIKIAFCHFPEVAHTLAESGKYGLVFNGHTHKPWTEKVGNVILANPGTLGGMFQKASFAVYDTGAKNLELKILETL
jgi:hypothetical protein